MYVLPTVVFFGVVCLLIIALARTAACAWMFYREEE